MVTPVGARGKVEVDLQSHCPCGPLGKVSLSIGTRADVQHPLEFVEVGRVNAMVAKKSLENIGYVFARMPGDEIEGCAVADINS